MSRAISTTIRIRARHDKRVRASKFEGRAAIALIAFANLAVIGLIVLHVVLS